MPMTSILTLLKKTYLAIYIDKAEKQMLWNWYTVDACFISSTWQVTSHGMFAGSCIGVIFLVISLEFLRRLQKEYDQHIAYHKSQSQYRQVRPLSENRKHDDDSGSGERCEQNINGHPSVLPLWARSPLRRPGLRPSASQQFIRAGIHMLQFGVAYFVMLLAMYYNGYFIICILIGAFLGAYIFNWEIASGGKE